MLTTGQAARRCSVTPNAVLKWIHSGKLPASRTAGGHFRVDERDLKRFVGAERLPRLPIITPTSFVSSAATRPFQYCWEHNGNGKLPDGCRQCAVYEMRAQRCYEVSRFAPDGHRRVFCDKTCEECDYYRIVHLQNTNVLVITDNQPLADSLKASSASAPFSLETTHCEYTCSALVQTFRPDYAVIDCALGQERSRDILDHLLEDPRIPFVRVVLAAEENELLHDCEHRVFATIRKPLALEDISALIGGTWARRAPLAAPEADSDGGAP